MSGHVNCYHYTTYTNTCKWMNMCIVTITLPVQSQVNEWSCILIPLQYLYKARTISSHVYCYLHTTWSKPCKWAVMCIITITLPVQSQDNQRSCVLLPLHYLYKARTMSGHVYCYHYTTCTKASTIRGHVYCYHYTTCTKPAQWAVMCIDTITLPLQSPDNEWSCVLLPLHYFYKDS
jgi:hypothetical protein